MADGLLADPSQVPEAFAASFVDADKGVADAKAALEGARAVGLTAGASAPEVLVNEVIDAFRDRFDVTIEQVETAQENVEFKVPRVLREPA